MSNSRFFHFRLFAALFHPWTWRMAWRDSRAERARLVVFSLAIVSGIAALVAIHSLKASVQTGIANQAKELLGSDLQISSNRPIETKDLEGLRGLAQRGSREISFPSMVRFADGGARLVQVRALESGYPFYGTIETEPPDAWARLEKEPGILLEPSLLDQFHARPGDEVELGGVRLRILGAITRAAPQANRFSGFAPAAYTRLADIEKSGLTGGNSMVNHLLHLELQSGPADRALKDSIRRQFPERPWRLETPEDRRENIGDALDLFQRFLGILAFASLALGALGVATAVHAHVTRRIPAIAILRCLGAPRHRSAAVYFAQTAAMGCLGSLLGAAIGIGIQLAVLGAFRDSLPVTVAARPEWMVALRAMVAGFAVCCGFALIPLLKIRHVSPAATLRSAAGLPGAGWRALPVYLAIGLLLVAVALANDPDPTRALALVGGLVAAFAVVWAVARALMSLARRFARAGWPYLARQGVSNLHRPGNQTMIFLLSLGMGGFILLTILFSGQLLRQRLTLGATGASPNLYLIDVQPDQLAGVKKIIERESLPVLESAPMVTMRIEAIRGVPVAKAPGVPRWITRREFRSTYRDRLNETETVIAGEFATRIADPSQPVPLSLEQDIAADLGLTLGDDITLDVQGVPVQARVTSLRKVDWSRFNLNFFMVFPPGVLENAPGFHVVTTRAPEPAASGRLQRALAGEFANVTAIDLTRILETVRDIFEKISLIVTILGGCTLFAAFPIVLGTLLNGRDVRLRESVLLRTLGASARQVRTILFVEYASLGALSAMTGCLLATGANAALASFVFKVSPAPDFAILSIGFLATVAVAVLGGLALSRGVSRHPPLEILRHVS